MQSRERAPRVLIVDDTGFQRERLRIFFESRGFEVVAEASDGREAILLFVSSRPDIVTMDVNMPYMNGIDAVIEIRRKDPSARIIMVSAMGDSGTIKEALKAGARDFVVKPYTSELLEKKVLEVLSDSFPDLSST